MTPVSLIAAQPISAHVNTNTTLHVSSCEQEATMDVEIGELISVFSWFHQAERSFHLEHFNQPAVQLAREINQISNPFLMTGLLYSEYIQSGPSCFIHPWIWFFDPTCKYTIFVPFFNCHTYLCCVSETYPDQDKY